MQQGPLLETLPGSTRVLTFLGSWQYCLKPRTQTETLGNSCF